MLTLIKEYTRIITRVEIYPFRRNVMQDFYYKQNADNTFSVMGYHGDEAEVIVPGSYGGAPVTVINDRLFAGHREITSVHIPDSVTNMGSFVFRGCENLHSIVLPAGLTDLWGYTFSESAFEEIVLPDRLTNLPPFTFANCRNLKRVVCGSGMKKIYAYVFGGCDELREVVCGPDVEISPDAYKIKPPYSERQWGGFTGR
jgi:hypothetical protein